MKILISGEASAPERILIPKKTASGMEDVDLDKIQALEETLDDKTNPDPPAVDSNEVRQPSSDEVNLRNMAVEEHASKDKSHDDNVDTDDLVEKEETRVPDVESGRVPVAVLTSNLKSMKVEKSPPPPPKRVSTEDMNMDDAGFGGDVDSGRGVDTVIDRKLLRDIDTSLLKKEIDEIEELVL